MTRRAVAAPTEAALPPADSTAAPLPPTPPEPAKAEFAPVVRSKIQPPALRSTTLSRQRLIDRLHEATASRLTLIVAEAGYGKTTLLADFASRSGQRTLWYRLDSTDADAITWANYLVAAGREVKPDFGNATMALLAQIPGGGPPNSVVMASAIDELQELGPAPTLFVLDDFQSVETSAEAREFVEHLLRDAPPWLHLVIASRHKPSLHLGRLEAMGELAQVGTDDLRFSLAETEHLFADGFGAPLEADVLRDVDQRTQGWAASLQLFYGSIRGKSSSDVRALAHSLSGDQSPLYDFLAEEVLANVPEELESFLVQSSVLDQILVSVIPHAIGKPEVVLEHVQAWIDESDRLGLLVRSTQSSEIRDWHPLLREFLLRRLRHRSSPAEIAAMHLRVAKALDGIDPLTATGHYLESGHEDLAMRCLEGSVTQTMGSGRWGVASELIDRLEGIAPHPGVAAIQCRRSIEDGDLQRAARCLMGIDLDSSTAPVRAIFRHAKLSLGWRTGDRDLMLTTLEEIKADHETPLELAEIFSVFEDMSSLSAAPVSFGELARRLERMAMRQVSAGHRYFASISLHNAAIMLMAAGRYQDATDMARRALDSFELVPGGSADHYSTHAVLATCALELGNPNVAEEHVRHALSSGTERGDVHAECGYASAVIGQWARASQLMLTSADLAREGRSDVTADLLAGFTRALMTVRSDPEGARRLLTSLPTGLPLDTVYELERRTLIALACLLAGDVESCLSVSATASDLASERGSRRYEARSALVTAMARHDADALREALDFAASVGDLAPLMVADAIGRYLWLIPEGPRVLRESISRWPARWLPILRHQLGEGGTANAVAAASLLDEFGDASDVGRLRAFAKTYRRSSKTSTSLGKGLARRVSTPLLVEDLGRTTIRMGNRAVLLGEMRRKPAALLMYLVTRPGYSATREQIVEELWPEGDPDSATNNLNQSLYFLRRDIDPWFEDDISVDYVGFQGDVIWLDPTLVRISSVDFVAEVRSLSSARAFTVDALGTLGKYKGQFCPEFEYEEWAMAWRNRSHALYLQFANAVVTHLTAKEDMGSAREAALMALGVDPTAHEIEQKLVWLYWHDGARSSAMSQYEHLTGLERADGDDPSDFATLTGDQLP